MTSATVKARLARMNALCLTSSLFQDRWQCVIHFDSRITPTVEGLPLPTFEEALEWVLNAAERVRRTH